MRRSFFAYVYNKGEQKLANTVCPYDLDYTNVGDGAIFALQKYDVLHTMYDKPAKQKRTNINLVLLSFLSETMSATGTSAMTSAKAHSRGIRSNNAVNSHGFRLRPCRNGVGFAFL